MRELKNRFREQYGQLQELRGLRVEGNTIIAYGERGLESKLPEEFEGHPIEIILTRQNARDRLHRCQT